MIAGCTALGAHKSQHPHTSNHKQNLSARRVLDLSCNSIACLLPLAGLPALRELCLQGNCIRDVAATGAAAGSFPCLEVLDLSFCALAPTALAFLGQLPQLRHLDISGKAAARRQAAALLAALCVCCTAARCQACPPAQSCVCHRQAMRWRSWAANAAAAG